MATVINRVTYFNIGGGQRQCSSLDMNSGGSRKTISSAYGNISGSRKQIFPYSATTIYTWNRYNLVQDYSRNVVNNGPINTSSITPGSRLWYGSSYTFTSDGYFILINANYLSCPQYLSGLMSTLSYMYWFDNSDSSNPPTRSLNYGISSVNGSTITTRDFLSLSSYSPSYSIGSYIDQATSSSRTAYPDNNYSGSYWYVFVS